MDNNLTYAKAAKLFKDNTGFCTTNHIKYKGFEIRIEVVTTRGTFSRYNLHVGSYIVKFRVIGRLDNVSYKEVDKLGKGYFKLDGLGSEKVSNKIEKIKHGIDGLIKLSEENSELLSSEFDSVNGKVRELLGHDEYTIVKNGQSRYRIEDKKSGLCFKTYDSSELKIEVTTSLTTEQFKKLLD